MSQRTTARENLYNTVVHTNYTRDVESILCEVSKPYTIDKFPLSLPAVYLRGLLLAVLLDLLDEEEADGVR
jgi:hypothetical protein